MAINEVEQTLHTKEIAWQTQLNEFEKRTTELQKVRKEDIPARVVYTSLYLLAIVYAYLTRFWRISLVLLTIHYLIEMFYNNERI